MPVIQYLIARRFPRSFARFLVWPVIFGAAGQIPPATLYFLWQFVTVSPIVNSFIRRRWLGWWSKLNAIVYWCYIMLTNTTAQYNYVPSGAPDTGAPTRVAPAGIPLGLSNSTFPDW